MRGVYGNLLPKYRKSKNGEKVMTSMGVSLYDGQETKAKTLVEEAIVALQRAQAQGENNLLFFNYN